MLKVLSIILVTQSIAARACDNPAKSGDNMSMQYKGTIDESSLTGEKGKQFDSSYDRNQAFDFVLGVGSVIKGWDLQLIDTCPGEKKTLIIPPELGYG